MVGRRPSARPRPSVPSTSSAPSANDAKVVVPRLNKDPLWSLQPWPLVVTIHGQEFEVPAMPAVDWLAYLMQPTPDLDGLLSDLIPEIDDFLEEGLFSIDELLTLALDVVETVGARAWWVTLRLIGTARGSWDVLGPEMINRRADATQLSLAAWLDVLLITILSGMEPKNTTMFTMKLEAPPPSAAVEQEEPEMDRGAFLAMS